ncbi:hypothetical protein BDV09DRAFT_184542 [Aspergillus tetrazonus]
MVDKSNKVALVLGTTGISGWALVKNALSYPSRSTFQRVIGLMHRPRTLEETGLPNDRRLELYSGVDLQADLDHVVAKLKEKIPRIEQVTHVYYLAYITLQTCNGEMLQLQDANVSMTYTAVHACDRLCPNMDFFVLQTGTNRANPRVPRPWSDILFYYAQVDLIKEANKGKTWKCIGYTPAQASVPNVAPKALYLALYRYTNGPGARVQFPRTPNTMARAELYLSLVKSDESHGEAFNIADTDTPGSWSAKWPSICRYFGLEASETVEDQWTDIDSWWYANQRAYERMCAEYGLQK